MSAKTGKTGMPARSSARSIKRFPVADGFVPRGVSTSAPLMRCRFAWSTIHSFAQGGMMQLFVHADGAAGER